MSPNGYKQVVVRRRRRTQKPVFNVRQYGRSAIKRLTPLSWFLVLLGMALFIVAGISLALRLTDANYQSVLLSDRLGQVFSSASTATATVTHTNALKTPKATNTVLVFAPTKSPLETKNPAITVTAAQKVKQIPLITVTPVVESFMTSTLNSGKTPTPAKAGSVLSRAPLPTAVNAQAEPVSGPTPEGGAPWAAKLVRQPDGTLLAPADVISKAVLDLTSYYTETHDLALADYLAQRDTILKKYYKGDALKAMQDNELRRTQYERPIAGSVTILVRNFTLDGYTAKAGIYLRQWISDDYDVSSRVLLRKGVKHVDTLIVMTVVFDKDSGRWMYSAVADVGDLKPKP